jgi:hypothetical protein
MPINEVATSIELRFLVDRHLAARRIGQDRVASVYAHAAEGLLTTALPAHSHAISRIASRKGDGRSIGAALALRLTPAQAAAVSMIWLLRGARRPAIGALSEAFRNEPEFNDTMRMLCARIMPPASNAEAARPTPIEIAAAYRR